MIPPVIGIAGPAGSGKSTAAAWLVGRLGFERVRFAGPLKAMMRALGLSEREIDGDLKEAPCAILGGRTPRHAMQTIGTEWGRELIDPSLWIRAWEHAADAARPRPVVADDVRFPNEVETIRARGGVILRIERPGLSALAAGHVSEQNAIAADLVVTNGGDVRALGWALSDALDRLDWRDHPLTTRRTGAAGPLGPDRFA